MADPDDNLSVFWKDSNKTSERPNHPINTWANTSISIPNLNPSSSIGYANYLTFQAAGNTIQGYNISWAAENTSIAPAGDGSAGYDQWVIQYLNGSDVYALPETYLTITAFAQSVGVVKIAVYVQMEGDDMVLWTRNYFLFDSPWTSSSASSEAELRQRIILSLPVDLPLDSSLFALHLL